MRYSQLFAKTLRQPPKDADTINHRLLTQACFVDQLMAGVYSYLPLGLRVLRKIEQIVREEMDKIGGQEVLMGTLHPKEIWEKTGGWDGIDVLFKIKSRTEKEYALGQSAEEVVTPLVMKYVHSYKDLPKAVYQIHWKYRDELRAKSGILRGREFLMKDMYSFHENQEDFDRFYAIVKEAYLKAFRRMGLVAKVTEASGGSFSEKISYEFMVLTDAGEDDILYCPVCDFCVNVEIAKVAEKEECPKCKNGKLEKARASEAGNVFDLGQKYGKSFDLGFMGRDGTKQYPIMGCFGIGITRIMGILVETHHDDRGIIWPYNTSSHDTVAPFVVHLVGLSDKAEEVYKKLESAGIDVFYDDRTEASAGEKFTDADLIGIPVRLVVSNKTGDQVEWKKRDEEETELISHDEVIRRVTA
jgi:prolyl-tRNA synthetase